MVTDAALKTYAKTGNCIPCEDECILAEDVSMSPKLQSAQLTPPASWTDNAIEPFLLAGNSIGYATDTIWGIGCIADDAEVVKSCLAKKGENRAPVCSALFPDLEEMKKWTLFDQLPEQAKLAVESCLPGPYTFALPVLSGATPGGDAYGARSLLHIAGEGPTVGCRVIPGKEAMKQVLKKMGKPLITTSLNLTGERSATTEAEAKVVCEKMGIACIKDDTTTTASQSAEPEAKRQKIMENAVAPASGKGSTVLKWDFQKAKFVVIRMGSGAITEEIENAGVELPAEKGGA